MRHIWIDSGWVDSGMEGFFPGCRDLKKEKYLFWSESQKKIITFYNKKKATSYAELTGSEMATKKKLFLPIYYLLF